MTQHQKTKSVRGVRWPCVLIALIPLISATATEVVENVADQAAPTLDAPQGIDEVVVVGEWPGPRLWKVSKDGRVVWLLGTLQPLPKGMTWKADEVKDILTHAQEVVGKTRVKPKVSVFGLLPLYFKFKKVAKLPDGKTLQDVLPAELYVRYDAIRRLYRIDDDGDRLRPMVAAGKLYQDVLEAVGLTNKNDIQETVFTLAKRHDVRVSDLTLEVEAPKEILDQVSQLPVEIEFSCFAEVLTSLEADLPVLRRRAAAWARGDVALLRQLLPPVERTACRDTVASVERVKGLSEKAESQWYAAITHALEHNQVTLGLSPVYELIGERGVIRQLREAGYQVDGP